MNENCLKIILNMIIIALALRVFYNTHNSSSVWEKAENVNNTTPYSQIVTINEKLSTLFFKIFKVNFEGECSYFTKNFICNFPSCAVCQCEEEDIPLPWKQESKEREQLDTQIEDKFQKWVDKFDTSSTQWISDSEIESKEGTYVNLLHNPEVYTGYQGQHIWKAIFSENCFSDHLDSICTEEKVFYKIFSGLLSNINIQISSNFHDFDRNHTYVNLSMLQQRVLDYPERIENLFFLQALMIKAFNKSEYLIRNFEINTGNTTEDKKARKVLDELYHSQELKDLSHLSSQYDEEITHFLNFNHIDQLMMRFRNISSIIECVSCQKCKLHGKLQLYGISAMLKILLDRNFANKSFKNMNLKLQRNELIAFINFLGKVSKSINYLRLFNENIKVGQRVVHFRYFYIIACYLIVTWYVNWYIFKRREKADNTIKPRQE